MKSGFGGCPSKPRLVGELHGHSAARDGQHGCRVLPQGLALPGLAPSGADDSADADPGEEHTSEDDEDHGSPPAD